MFKLSLSVMVLGVILIFCKPRQDGYELVLVTREKETVKTVSCNSLNGKEFSFLSEDSLKIYIRFSCNEDSLSGMMSSPYLQGDHGVFYFLAPLQSARLDSSGISFIVVPGKLFGEEISIESGQSDIEPSGHLRSEMFFAGNFLTDSTLVVQCRNEFNDCYTSGQMTFVSKN